MDCTICGGNSKLVFIKKDYQILECKKCGHFFTDLNLTSDELENIYSDKYFFDGGDGYPGYIDEKDLLIRRGEYYASKVEKVTKKGKVLDIGSAAGFILKGFENRGWAGTGIEPNKTMAEFGRNALGVNIRHGSIEKMPTDEKFDLVVMIQVVAHLFSLKDAMLSISDKLKNGGHLLIETWNKDSVTARVFGSNWHEYSPPGTLNFFNKFTLDGLAIKYGFTKVSSGRPRKSISGKHAKSLLKFKFENAFKMKWMVKIISLIPDKLRIPYPSEDLFWALYVKTNDEK